MVHPKDCGFKVWGVQGLGFPGFSEACLLVLQKPGAMP